MSRRLDMQAARAARWWIRQRAPAGTSAAARHEVLLAACVAGGTSGLAWTVSGTLSTEASQAAELPTLLFTVVCIVGGALLRDHRFSKPVGAALVLSGALLVGTIVWWIPGVRGAIVALVPAASAAAATLWIQRGEALAELEQRSTALRAFVQSVRHGMLVLDSEGRVVELNEPAQLMLQGLVDMPPQVGEALGEFSGLEEAQRLQVEHARARAQRGEEGRCELELSGEDGDPKLFVLECSPVGYPNHSGAHGTAMTLEDVTEARAAERERSVLKERALEGQKLESLGMMAGTFAHDFNNLLTGVLCEVELAREYEGDTEFVHESLVSARDAVLKASELTRSLLTYAGKSPKRSEDVEMGRLLEEVCALARPATSRRVEIVVEDHARRCYIRGDRTQLEQVVLNLVVNAVDATGDANHPVLVRVGSTWARADELVDSYTRTELEDGLYIYVEVEDRGVGMTPEQLQRAFEPFYTSKPTGRGLGLAATLGIIRAHHGGIFVDSTPGEGTTFRVLLPESAVVREEPEAEELSTRHMLAKGTALVIDDQEHVRTALLKILTAFGFEAMGAPSGPQGVQIYEAHGEVDVVLLDMTMPEMAGEDALVQLKAIDACAQVILMSGYSDADVEGMLYRYASETVQFVSKPITREALLGALNRLPRGLVRTQRLEAMSPSVH
ncbi:MAG: ATP-binding protein [Myxococcota bacterium]